MEKVIFDTNSVRNTEPKKFLGGRSELERFAKVAEIIIPDMVIGEIRNQKRVALTSKKQSFLNNPFHWLRDLNDDETKGFDIEAHILKQEADETIEYQVISLSDYSVLEQMKDFALKNKPPFDANSDKGFKDAYIYFTTLEYSQEISDKLIFVYSKDTRLKDAFRQHPNITVIESFDGFIQCSIISFHDDYFVEKLKSEVHTDITKENIIDYWININDNRVLLIELSNEKYVVEVDCGEIVAFEKVEVYSEAIDSLIKSGTFAITHSAIELLSLHVHFLSDDDILKVLEAAKENEQIHWVIGDEDVKQFISTLYSKKKEMPPAELAESIKNMLEK